jgi:hypothetical protein
MRRVFNMGLGLIVVARPDWDPRAECPSALEVGRIVPGLGQQRVIFKQ